MNEPPKLVVFWTLKSRPGYDGKRYRKRQMATEFPADKIPESAIEEILQEFGRVDDISPSGYANLQHAVIASHSIIHYHERAKIDTWKASQEQLFDSVEWQRCISYSPQRA